MIGALAGARISSMSCKHIEIYSLGDAGRQSTHTHEADFQPSATIHNWLAIWTCSTFIDVYTRSYVNAGNYVKVLCKQCHHTPTDCNDTCTPNWVIAAVPTLDVQEVGLDLVDVQRDVPVCERGNVCAHWHEGVVRFEELERNIRSQAMRQHRPTHQHIGLTTKHNIIQRRFTAKHDIDILGPASIIAVLVLYASCHDAQTCALPE
jgi:hypothetical protein